MPTVREPTPAENRLRLARARAKPSPKNHNYGRDGEKPGEQGHLPRGSLPRSWGLRL